MQSANQKLGRLHGYYGRPDNYSGVIKHPTLSTVLDDFSRYILAWKLCTTMTAADVTETLRLALTAAGLNQAIVQQRPRLLSDNGPSYLSAHLSAWLEERGMSHTAASPTIR